MKSSIQDDPTFDDYLSKGDKRWDFPASYSCRWSDGSATYSLEIQAPRQGQDFRMSATSAAADFFAV